MKSRSALTLTLCLLFSFHALNSQSLYQVGYYSVNGISSMAAMPGYLVLGNGSIVDVSNPSNPTLAGQVSINGFSTSVLIAGDMAWFGTGMSVKLIGVNIADPTTPRVVSVHSFPDLTGGVFGMSKSGNYLYLAMGIDGVYVMNISDPANPVLVDSLLIPGGQVRDVVVRDSLAYLAHYEGLKVAHTGDPANLRLLSGTGYGYNSIALDDSFLYAGKQSGGIDVYRLTNPQEPELVCSLTNFDGWAWDLTCHRGMVLESTDLGGVYVYAMENGEGTQKAFFPNTENGQAFSVAAQDSLIFLSGLINGVAVLVYDPNGSAGITDHGNLPEITLYPVPANDFIEVRLPGDAACDISIHTITGSRLMQIPGMLNTVKIDISQLPEGQYVLKATSRDYSVTRKLLICR